MPGPAANTFSPGPNFKLGLMKKKCGGFQKWGVRYLILDKLNRILHYYHTPKDATPKRSLDLNTCTISRLTADESPKDPGFKISIPNVRDFVFVGTNSTIVDDWVNALFQAKAPSTAASAKAQEAGTPANGSNSSLPAGTMNALLKQQGDDFSYNGPTLAVLPNKSTNNMSGTNNLVPVVPPSNDQNILPPSNKNTETTKSTQSSMIDNTGNETLVAQPDTNSTLVAGGQKPVKVPAGQPVPVLILTPDNKKFPSIEKPVTGILKIGRYVGNQPQSTDTITFKSKVISRNHAEIWAVNGEIYIRDTRSQSGTFLNAMRLSEPSKESKPYRLKPGDVIQFGVDYKGAVEDNARCLSVRVDIKSKILEPLPLEGMSLNKPTGEHEATLVGGGNTTDSTTLVGKSTTASAKSDRTLIGQNNEESTLYPEPGHPMPPQPKMPPMQNMRPMMQQPYSPYQQQMMPPMNQQMPPPHFHPGGPMMRPPQNQQFQRPPMHYAPMGTGPGMAR